MRLTSLWVYLLDPLVKKNKQEILFLFATHVMICLIFGAQQSNPFFVIL